MVLSIPIVPVNYMTKLSLEYDRGMAMDSCTGPRPLVCDDARLTPLPAIHLKHLAFHGLLNNGDRVQTKHTRASVLRICQVNSTESTSSMSRKSGIVGKEIFLCYIFKNSPLFELKSKC